MDKLISQLRRSIWISLLLLLTSCHLGRFVVYNFANITDYKIFPEKEIKTAGEVFYFEEKQDSKLGDKIDNISLNSEKFGELQLTEFLDKQTETVAFIVIKSDKIIYEQYFEDYQEESIVTSFSVAKSFVSSLVGIAIADGFIKSVEDPITQYLPELAERNPDFEKITIKHLLNMRSGLKFNENSYTNPFAEIAKLYYGKNHLKQISKTKIDEAPGSSYEYQSINTEILGIIVEKATGRALADYFEEKIWQPIGMEYDASWNIDSKKHQNPKAYCCLNARAIDFAKLGRLYLKMGNWEGQQLISKEWIAKSVIPNFENECYQYQWYSKGGYRRNMLDEVIYYSDSLEAVKEADPLFERVRASTKYNNKYYIGQCGPAYMAIGILGQYIYVDPEQELIIVRFGKKNDFSYSYLFDKIGEHIKYAPANY